jgi:hypothetical protein
MARKKTEHGLPVLPKVPTVTATADHTSRLLKVLRRVAVSNQRNEAQSFYPVREVAERFRMPISSVVRVYSQLEKEGLLSRIRGSKTMLTGRCGPGKLMVRGFIARPARLSSFMALQDYRMFFTQTRHAFRKRGFVTTNVFFQDDKKGPDVLLQSIKQGNVETVLWYLPDVHAKETILRLSDMGIRVIGVCDRGWSAIPCQYRIYKEIAIRTILQEWQCHEVKSIKVLRTGNKCVLGEARLERLLHESSIPYETVRLTSESVQTILHSVCLDHSGALILPAAAASYLSFCAPQLLVQLLQACRVALIDGLVSIPYAEAPDAKIDFVTVDWEKVAERITWNVMARENHLMEPERFEAKAYLRVPLCEYAQSI